MKVTVPDQAQRLRELVSSKKSRARVISFTSGKGGVGKTNLALSMALSLIAMKLIEAIPCLRIFDEQKSRISKFVLNFF